MWVRVEVSAFENVSLARGWQAFARARGLSRRCTLHFKFDGVMILFVRVFREDGRRAGCCRKDDGGDDELDLDDNRDDAEGELPLGDDGGGSSSESTSSGGYDHPPCRRARFQEGGRSSRRDTLVKREVGLG